MCCGVCVVCFFVCTCGVVWFCVVLCAVLVLCMVRLFGLLVDVIYSKSDVDDHYQRCRGSSHRQGHGGNDDQIVST